MQDGQWRGPGIAWAQEQTKGARRSNSAPGTPGAWLEGSQDQRLPGAGPTVQLPAEAAGGRPFG